jgi:hypothetical protein
VSGETFLCSYCAAQKPVADRSVEHIIPAALGGALVTDKVCHGCNQRAGDEVDAPFISQFWVRELRHRYEIPDRYGKLTSPPVFPTELDDGTKVLAILDRAGWRAKLLPAEEWHDAQTMTLSLDSADEAVVAKKLERLEKNSGQEATLMSRQDHEVVNPRMRMKYAQDVTLWPRMGAKIALAVAAERMPESFLSSPAAGWLRQVLWGNMSTAAPPGVGVSPHLAGELMSEPVPRWVNPPPEHQLMVIQLGDAAGVVFTLFGELRYYVRLGPDSVGASPGVYILDPTRHKSKWLGWAEWSNLMGERISTGKERSN